MDDLIDEEVGKNVWNWEWVESVLICLGVAQWKAYLLLSNHTYFDLIDAFDSKKLCCLEWFELQISEIVMRMLNDDKPDNLVIHT